jgi:hypothetical protein
VTTNISTERAPETKEFYKLRLDKTKRFQIVKFLVGKGKSAKMIYLCVDLIYHFRCEGNTFVATLE